MRRPKLRIHPFPVGTFLSLALLVCTYLTYYYRHQMHYAGSYVPLIIGLGSFSALMVWLNYRALAPYSTVMRVALAATIALGEVTIFLLILFFLILNTIGS